MAAKYETLDGLRGIAAIAVLLYHLESPLHVAAEAGYLAVDLFFLMSGFVVAGAYEARLLAGWSVGAFMRVRLRRLWPLYVAGLALGIACFELIRVIRPDLGVVFPAMPVAAAALLSLFFLPQLQPYGGPAFPFNSASWSLSVEIFGNLFYAAFARHLRNRLLVVSVAFGFAGLVLCIVQAGGLDVGVGKIGGGYLRFLFSFPLGVLLHRLHAIGRLRIPRVPPALPLLLAVAICAGVFGHGGVTDLVAVSLGFPAILVMSLGHSSSPRLARWFGWAGAVSYALYVLHPPLIELAVALFGPHPGAFAALILDGAIIAFAALAERYFDRPLQRYLRSVDIAPPAPRLAERARGTEEI